MIGKFFLRVFAGLLVATLVTGGKALVLAGAAIVCTAGAGLLIVLPVAYLIGLLCTIWFIPFGENKNADSSVLPSPSKSLPTMAALEQYIEASLKRGTNRSNTRWMCQCAGWPEVDIDAAYQAVKSRMP